MAERRDMFLCAAALAQRSAAMGDAPPLERKKFCGLAPEQRRFCSFAPPLVQPSAEQRGLALRQLRWLAATPSAGSGFLTLPQRCLIFHPMPLRIRGRPKVSGARRWRDMPKMNPKRSSIAKTYASRRFWTAPWPQFPLNPLKKALQCVARGAGRGFFRQWHGCRVGRSGAPWMAGSIPA